MADDAPVVNETPAPQDSGTTDSTPVENNSPEATDASLVELYSDDNTATKAETDSPAETPDEEQNGNQAEETPAEEQERGEEKPLTEKSQNRFQQLANERNEWREKYEQLHAQVYQPQTAEELIEEGLSPELAEVRALKQELEVRNYTNRVVEAVSALDGEAGEVIKSFPIFNPDSPDYQEDLATSAAQALQASFIRDPNTGQVIGSHLSPFQIYKPIADAYTKSRLQGQLQGQKSTDTMLSNTDSRGSAAPRQPKKDPLMELWD